MSASFFMIFGKRRNEIITQGPKTRAVLSHYNEAFLGKFMYVSLVLTLVFYSLWSIDPVTTSRLNNEYIIYTIPLIFLILMKYCLDIENNSSGDPVDVLTTDKPLMGLVIIYIISLITIVYVI